MISFCSRRLSRVLQSAAAAASTLALAALPVTVFTAPVQAQASAFDTRPEMQDPDAVAEIFGVEVDALPDGSDWLRLPGADGRSDGLHLEVPVTVTATWDLPAPYAVSCPARLVIARTADRPGSDGLPAGIQMVMVGSGGLGGGFVFPVVEREAVVGRFLTASEQENYDIMSGPPPGVSASMVVLPAPNCLDVATMASNISGRDLLRLPEVQRDLAEADRDERRLAEQVLSGLDTILGPQYAPGNGTASVEQLQQAACFAQPVPVMQVLDASPENFHVLFGGTVEGPDEDMCPVISARGQIHAGAPIDAGVLQVVSHSPEAVVLRAPDQNPVECTNNDPEAPLVEIRFSQGLERRSMAGNVRLMVLSPSGWEDSEAEFSTDGHGLVYLEAGQVLRPLTRYRVEVTGGANGVRGLSAGSQLGDSYNFEFQTAPARDSDSFAALYGEAVGFHAYQGSRDAPVLPGRPVMLRAGFDWPPESERNDTETMPDQLCLRLDAFEPEGGRGTPARFDTTDFPFLRIDRVTDTVRRMGRDRALVSGWTPARGEGRQARLSMRVGLVNFTSAESGRESPELTYAPGRTLDVLPEPITVPVRLFSLQFDEGGELDDVVIAGRSDFETISNQALGNRGILNDGARRLAGYAITDWADVESATRRFLPVNHVPLWQGGTVEMRGVGTPQTLIVERDGEMVPRDFALSGGAGNSSRDLHVLTVQIEEFFRRAVLPACSGRQVCMAAIPIPYDGARAFYDAQGRHRGFLFGLDSIPYRHRIPTVTAHEIGHTFGLAHVPNDYNRRGEQARIRREVEAIRSRGALRWTGIDQVMLWPDGHVGYRHSRDGNSEHRDLWPLMYNTALDPREGGIQMDQYDQVLRALRNPSSTNPVFYGPHLAEAGSSSEDILEVIHEMNRLRWRETDGGSRAEVPVIDYAGDGGTPGVMIGLALVRQDGAIELPYRPMVLSATGSEGAAGILPVPAGEALRVEARDGDGRIIAGRSIDHIPDNGREPVWLNVFLALGADDALRVRDIRILEPGSGRLLAERAVAGLDASGPVEATAGAGIVALNWGAGDPGRDVRLTWVPRDGSPVLLAYGRDRGAATVRLAGLQIDAGAGVVRVEWTNGVAVRRSDVALVMPDAPGPEARPFPVPAARWEAVLSEPAAGVLPGLPGGDAERGPDVPYPGMPVPVLARHTPETVADAVEAVRDIEPGYMRDPASPDGGLVRIPDGQACALTPADVDVFVEYQLAAMPEEARGIMGAELRRSLLEALENPAYDRRAMCEAVAAIRNGDL